MNHQSSKISTPLMHIPMSSPDIDDADKQAVLEVLQTSRLSQGERTAIFETTICELTGSKHAIAVSSGTSGLHLCVRAAGIAAGDLVITTPFSFVASSNVLLYERAIPIFVDIDKRTGNINSDLLAGAIRDLMEGGDKASKWYPRKGVEGNRILKALIPVDVFGQPADYDSIQTIANANRLIIIEDSCEALGSTYKQKQAGSFGDFGVFAFYPNKQITTGEGGMIITNRDESAELIRALRNQGRAPGDTWLQHTYLGYNYRIDEMSAALGAAQLLRLDELISKRENVARWYNEKLAEVPGIQPPNIATSTTRMSWFVYVVQVSESTDRDLLAKKLEARGIPVRPYFLPIHLQPYMVERFGYREGDFPVTEEAGRRGLALPFSGVMSEQQVDYVCAAIREELQTNS